MQTFQPDFLTAFGMTALAAFTVSWVMWILGRQYGRQGMTLAIVSTATCGVAYTCFALQSRLGIMELQVTAKILISVAISAFTIALQHFRQNPDLRRDSFTLLGPFLASLALAMVYLPGDLPSFNRMQTVVTVVQSLGTLRVLFRMRPNTPGMGWKLVTVALLGQLLSIIPLVFVKDRASPDMGAGIPLASLLAMWALCLVLFLKLVVTSVGFLIMLRDRHASLERYKALLDPLTQLPNRTALVRDLKRAMDAASRSEKPLSVMVLDIDHFKRFNDQHGHLAGDQVIQMVARILKQQSRDRDVISRYGGEEFVLVLPDTAPHEAQAMAQRLCHAIRNTPLTLASGEELRVTVSVGIHADVPTAGLAWEPLVDAADAAMYRAKRSGRDRVVISSRSVADAGVLHIG